MQSSLWTAGRQRGEAEAEWLAGIAARLLGIQNTGKYMRWIKAAFTLASGICLIVGAIEVIGHGSVADNPIRVPQRLRLKRAFRDHRGKVLGAGFQTSKASCVCLSA